MEGSYQALYRQWRPMNFDEVVGQEAVVAVLRQAVKTNEIAHAYLFSGTRGTGKTSLAKIFARAVNCLNPHDGNPCNECEICESILDRNLLDVIEMDAASNNSVDDVRRIIEEVVYMPSRAKYKVYIIDEVHMLSTAAFNALLKTLEEPPAHVIFILATTEPQRLPATILSRCQRYDFHRIPLNLLIGRLRKIADTIDLPIEDEALELIARLADGALRDAISLLDQCRISWSEGDPPLDRASILEMTGRVNDAFLCSLLEALVRGDAYGILSAVQELASAGQDYRYFTTELVDSFRNLLILKACGPAHAQEILTLPPEILQRYAQIAGHLELSELQTIISRLDDLLRELRFSPQPRLALETTLLTLPMGELRPNLLPATALEVQKSAAPPAPDAKPAPESKEAETPETAQEAEAPQASEASLSPGEPEVQAEKSEDPVESKAPAGLKKPGEPEPLKELKDAEEPLEAERSKESAAPVTAYASNDKKDSIDVLPPKFEPEGSAPAEGLVKSAPTPAEAPEVTEDPRPFDPVVGEALELSPEEASKPVPAAELEAQWETLLNAIEQEGDAFLQLTLRHCKHGFDDGKIIIAFVPDDEALYNDLKQPKMLRALNRATKRVFGLREATIELRLEGSDGQQSRPEIVRDRSAWLEAAKALMKQHNIPVEEEEDGE